VRAAHVCKQGIKQYPGQIELLAESLLLEDFMSSSIPETIAEH